MGIQFRAMKDYVNLFTWSHSVSWRKYVFRKKIMIQELELLHFKTSSIF
jgi:hypothetical protein